MKHLFVLGFLFLGINVFAQGLTITNGTKEITFKKGSIYHIHMTKGNVRADGKTKNWTELLGEIHQTSQDSFSMILTSYVHRRTIDYVDVQDIIYSETGKNYGIFPQEDIALLKRFKSYKSQKRKRTWTGIGGLLVFTGMITSLNALLVPKELDRGHVLISGGIQVGLGLSALIASSTKKYSFKCDDDPLWEIKH